MHAEFWSENLKGRDHLYDLGIYGNRFEGNGVWDCGPDSSVSQ